MNIKLSKSAAKTLSNMDRPTQRRIKSTLNGLGKQPPEGEIKALQDYSDVSVAEQVAEMVNMLPDSEQVFALEFVKRLALAWDPDFTKMTASEAHNYEEALKEFERGEAVPWRLSTGNRGR